MCQACGERLINGLSHHKVDVLSRGTDVSSIVTATSIRISVVSPWSVVFSNPKRLHLTTCSCPKLQAYVPDVSLNLQRAQKYLIHLAFSKYQWLITSLWWNTTCFHSLTRVLADDSEGLVVHIWLCYVGRHISHSTWQGISGWRAPCRGHSSAPPGPPRYCGCSSPSLPSPTRSHWAIGTSPWRCTWPCPHHQSYQIHLGHFRVWLKKNKNN